MGAAVVGDGRYHTMLMMVGPTRSGKGTICNVFRSLVGKDAYFTASLTGLTGTFGLQPLVGKKVVAVTDARLTSKADAKVIAETLLPISGGDGKDVNRKHLPTIHVEKWGFVVVCSNELPRLEDASGALAGRFVLLKMNKSFKGVEDRGLADRLKEEMPSILLWALAGYRRLRERGGFVQPKAGRDDLDQLVELGSPVAAFVHDRCEVGQDQQAPCQAVYDAYRMWAADNGEKVPPARVFGRDLFACVNGLTRNRVRIDGKQVWHYAGLGV
jgi:putative DNA primase/helicase